LAHHFATKVPPVVFGVELAVVFRRALGLAQAGTGKIR
jgi:hypothetical protein